MNAKFAVPGRLRFIVVNRHGFEMIRKDRPPIVANYRSARAYYMPISSQLHSTLALSLVSARRIASVLGL